MMGHKIFQPKRFHQISLEERVPRDHLLRQVAEAVDCAFVRQLTARFYRPTGQPGIDPVVLVKLARIGYLYGITSERRLAEELRLNLACRWFVGDALDERTPDHAVRSNARRRFGVPVYQACFTEIVRQCVRAGLIAGEQVFVDSTLVEANADIAVVGSRALVEQLAGVDEHVAALWRDNPAPVAHGDAPPAPPVEPPTASPDPTSPESGPPAMPQQPQPLGPDDQPNGAQGTVNTRVASRTDPDAGLVSRPGVPLAFYHQVHVGVDGGQARSSTAVDVTPGASGDEELLDRRCKEHAGTTGHLLAEVVADAKYGTFTNYQTVEAQGIRASIPPHDNGSTKRAIPRDQFTDEPGADRFRCPEGQLLKRQGCAKTAHANGAVIYRASPKVCGTCARKAECCGTAQARTISRPNDGGLAERVRADLATPPAKRSIRRRMCWAETAMAELKERHGLRRAQCRGRDQVRIQALGAAMADNIKKLARTRAQRPEPIALALRQRTTALCHESARPVRHPRYPRHPRHRTRLRQQAPWKHLGLVHDQGTFSGIG